MKTNANLKQLILAVSLSLLAFPLIKSQGDKRAENKANVTEYIQEVGDFNSSKVNQARRDIYIINTTNVNIDFSKSIDFKVLKSEVAKAQLKLPAELKKNRQKKEKEKRERNKNIIILKKFLNNIPIKTERLKKVKELFNKGKYVEARRFLEKETPNMLKEGKALLKRVENQKEQLKEIQKKLRNNAEESITLAKLTSIDYSLKDQRIPKTRAYFKQALKSNRSPKNLFEYAVFLQKNNLSKDSERHYQEALKYYRQLSKDNAGVYLPIIAGMLNNLALLISKDSNRRGEAETLYQEALKHYHQPTKDNADEYLPRVADTLNNLANLVSDDNNRQGEAETLYQEALKYYRQLPKDNAGVYLPNIAGMLNNLALLVAKDNNRRSEAETLYQEALKYYRQLAKDNAGVYLPDIATTLNNLAVLVAKDSSRRSEAETLYQEALKYYRQLAKDNAGVYLPYVATTLNNLAVVVAKDSNRRVEVETLYLEALKYYHQLSKDNAGVYLPEVANTSGAMGLAYFQWGQNSKALPLLRETTKILRSLLNKSPSVYAQKQALFLMLLALASDQANEQCKASREALSLTKNDRFIVILQGIKKKSCQ